MSKDAQRCRNCNGELIDVLDLGYIHPSDFVLPGQQTYPPQERLILTGCEDCQLIQLKHTIDPDEMYRQYWYRSGINPSMVDALQDIVNSTLEKYGKEKGITVDIGCNDGTMLSMYPPGFRTIGFDPAKNLTDEAELNCDLFINDYFRAGEPLNGNEANIVTAIAMFYDLDDPRAFLTDVMQVLAYDGIFVIQMTDLVSMLKNNAFDNICHEHLCYYSLCDIDAILTEYDLEIFDVEYNGVNGGSIRIYICWAGEYDQQDGYVHALQDEVEYFNSFIDPLTAFANRVMASCLKTMERITLAKAEGKAVWGLGASTKGNTLLQFMGLRPPIIDCIAEINEDKFGKETIGTEIPITPEDNIPLVDPDILLVLPWHFNKFFERKFDDYLQAGGELLFPLPYPRSVVYEDGEKVYKLWSKERFTILPWAT